ncbi:ribonuclease H-like domain-containing protein [Candidatus Dojkabacteria bacterium]|uniref:Ribonuclease H-like domain-containing protein n=1 Tax=Candidatus Dojkabacteria bacterium TaxID=2099670 RepID=A0A955HYP3_9BACT|nr:ribonuclease H-like domain-containing protein [Candidatus Dojkabacteria bacterium]
MLFLDIETQNDWVNGDSFKIKDLKISFVGVINGDTGEELGFWEKELDSLGELLRKGDTVVHYNGFTFDMPVLANYLGDSITDIPQIDLMVAAYKTIGFRPKLEDLAMATLGHGKNGSGADAVKYWAAGDTNSLQKLRDYCIQDVRVTKELYEFGEEEGYIKYYDRNGFVTEVQIDWSAGGKITEKTNVDVISLF